MVGYGNASSADMAPVEPALEDGDLAGVAARGELLWKMQRAMRLGDRAFSGFVGVTASKFVGLASIDPGGGSGQVAYYRWDEAQLEDGDATASEARNWVVCPLTFDPDEALEPTELGGRPSGETQRALAAVLVAEQRALEEFADGRWVIYTFREQVVEGGVTTRQRQTRVYLLGADDKSPDIEFTVLDPVKKKQGPKVANKELQLPGGGTGQLPLRTPAPAVGPSTVARAAAIAAVTDKAVKIIDGSGGKWQVKPGAVALDKL